MYAILRVPKMCDLFYKAEKTHIDQTLTALLRSLYNDLESQVVWRERISEPFPILQGVRQGGVLSPLLYTLFIDDLIKTLKEQNLGCHLLNHYAGVIVLADDVALLSSSQQELQKMLDITYNYAKTWKYRINPDKSRILEFNSKTQNKDSGLIPKTLKIGEDPIPTTTHHPHLGITKSSGRLDPTDSMITRGTHTFYALTGAGAYTGGLLPHHCARLWKTYCIPRMLYGAPVMILNQTMRRKLDRTQYQLFKKILGLPNSAADESVYLLTGLIPLSAQVDKEILLLIGQLVNLPHWRYEVRTLLHAMTNPTPLLKMGQSTLQRYGLPDLHSLLTKPIPYSRW